LLRLCRASAPGWGVEQPADVRALPLVMTVFASWRHDCSADQRGILAWRERDADLYGISADAEPRCVPLDAP